MFQVQPGRQWEKEKAQVEEDDTGLGKQPLAEGKVAAAVACTNCGERVFVEGEKNEEAGRDTEDNGCGDHFAGERLFRVAQEIPFQEEEEEGQHGDGFLGAETAKGCQQRAPEV